MATSSIPFLSTKPARSVRIGARQLWSVARAMLRARATRRLLAEMDGRMLADIGVSRGDAQFEVSRPFWDYGGRR